ncbi:MAG: hypothetical protein EAZ65_04175 [Verrucomicrobia bacterium]|nr:MAG: hypothetical protein EAZ82_04855 [Verrucomicrobiota bacterium]TAF27020.1 MAG: hypothetical protein EAZ71_04170 [Verrucomicrobiota bacterium]TAF42276.1 MAG: hypothetical protein EAZ65_04175 [Verrucomicrobiota bacterium]
MPTISSRGLVVLPVITLALQGPTFAATANWKNNTSGNWSDTAKWNPATVPNAAGTVVRYTHAGTASAAGNVTP